jgi:transposase-like protein
MEFAMQPFTPAQAEEALTHLTQHFAQWRQSRRTLRGRIPAELWARAVALTATFSVSRVAKQLGLTSHALKRRRDTLTDALTPTALSSSPRFVEVTTPWRTPATEVEIHRPDGTRMRITYSEGSPALVPLLQTFLESR